MLVKLENASEIASWNIFADIEHNQLRNSALAEHSSNTKHHICIEKTFILAKVDHYFHRKSREAIKINKHPKNLNRDEG